MTPALSALRDAVFARHLHDVTPYPGDPRARAAWFATQKRLHAAQTKALRRAQKDAGETEAEEWETHFEQEANRLTNAARDARRAIEDAQAAVDDARARDALTKLFGNPPPMCGGRCHNHS